MKHILLAGAFLLALAHFGQSKAAGTDALAPRMQLNAVPECPEQVGKPAAETDDEGREKILNRQATLEDLKAAFRSTEIFDLANYINAMGRYAMGWYEHRMAVVELWRDVWAVRRDKYPGFSWACLQHPFVKVSLAQILAEGDPGNYDTYHKYIKDNLEDDNGFVRGNAAGALGIIGSNKDIPRLERVILSDNVKVAGNAVHGLFSINSVEAKETLTRLYKEPGLDLDKKDVIYRVLKYPGW